MEAKTKQMLFSLIHAKFPGMDAEIDIDWDIAEITYKAGKKEVVDWVNKHGITHGVVGSKFILSPHTGFNSTGWQAKLKEWHIEPD